MSRLRPYLCISCPQEYPIPILAGIYHLKWKQIDGSRPQTWYCSLHPNGGHIPVKRKKKWYFVNKICTELLWEKNVLVIEKIFWNLGVKAEYLQNFWITRPICSISERSEQFEFLVTEWFFWFISTCSWRFLICNKLEQLEIILEIIIGI